MAEILYATNDAQVHRHSSIDQFAGFLSAWKRGGWAPIVFDQIDSIGECSGIKSHPVVIDLTGESLGYVYPEAKCVYISDRFVYFDKHGVEQKALPECMGEGFYEEFIDKYSFLNFDGSSLGVHNQKKLRVGLDYVTCENTLPAVD